VKKPSSINDQYWIKKNPYYYKKLAQFYTFVIPPGSRVLQVDCKSGYLLNTVNPSYGLGIDSNANYIDQANKTYGNNKKLTFAATTIYDLAQQNAELFDYIIVSHTLMEEYDIQQFLETLHTFCSPETRIVINICSWLWEPIIKLGQATGMSRKATFKNWIHLGDLKNFLALSDYEPVASTYRTLVPKNIPLVAPFFNKIIANIPPNRAALS